jgi:putative flippase GtrA
VPVDWVDDPDSRVDIVQTALTDLKGVSRLLLASPVVRFAGVGVLSTLAYALIFLLLSGPLGVSAAVANLLGLAITAVANTAANRRLTFGIRGRDDAVRQHALGFLVFVLTLTLTSGALATLHGIDAQPARWVELTVLVLSSFAATVTRYVALRSWVFAAGRTSRRAAAESSADRPALQRAEP